MSLVERMRSRDARTAVIGLGYVGLPLAVEFCEAGYHVVGIDVNQEKVDHVNAGESYIKDVPSDVLRECVASGRLIATADFSTLAECDTVNICVPTPLRKTRDPDISYIVSAVEEIQKYIHPGMLVVLESTTYPGTTEEVILPLLQRDDFRVGEQFFLAFSPERVDPGNPQFTTKNIPKVVGGVTPACTEVASALYSAALSTIVPVSSAKVAETVKLLENMFRCVNIGLVNEIALMCKRWISTSGKSFVPRRPSLSDSCRFTLALGLGAIAFPSTRSTCRGRRNSPVSRRGSSNSPGRSTAPCPSTSSRGSSTR